MKVKTNRKNTILRHLTWQKTSGLLVLFLSLFFIACTPKEPIATHKYENNPKFTWGFADFFGSYYDNYDIEKNVISLSLFTDKFIINENNELDGYGQYLIIEDIFIAPNDTLLPSGTYHTSVLGEAFSFFPGKKYKIGYNDISSGAYIYYVEIESFRSKIAYVTDGSFTINQLDAINYEIDIDFTLDNKDKLTGSFRGELPHFDRAIREKPTNSVIRKLLFQNSLN